MAGEKYGVERRKNRKGAMRNNSIMRGKKQKNYEK